MEQKQLKEVAHLYLRNEVRIFNKVTNQWSANRKMSCSDLNLILNYDAQVEFILKDLSEMPYSEYCEIDKLTGNQGYLLSAMAEKTIEAIKRGYDLFGLLESGEAAPF